MLLLVTMHAWSRRPPRAAVRWLAAAWLLLAGGRYVEVTVFERRRGPRSALKKEHPATFPEDDAARLIRFSRGAAASSSTPSPAPARR